MSCWNTLNDDAKRSIIISIFLILFSSVVLILSISTIILNQSYINNDGSALGIVILHMLFNILLIIKLLDDIWNAIKKNDNQYKKIIKRSCKLIIISFIYVMEVIALVLCIGEIVTSSNIPLLSYVMYGIIILLGGTPILIGIIWLIIWLLKSIICNIIKSTKDMISIIETREKEMENKSVDNN
jgi:hypothetical protein